MPLPSLLLSSEMSFLTLYSLTESVFDNAELPLRQAEETVASKEAAGIRMLKTFLTHL